jgi:hypothetical protein
MTRAPSRLSSYMAACSAKYALCRRSVVTPGGFAYSHIIGKRIAWSMAMNLTLTLKTLVVLALVVEATAVIVGGDHAAATWPLPHQTILN